MSWIRGSIARLSETEAGSAGRQPSRGITEPSVRVICAKRRCRFAGNSDRHRPLFLMEKKVLPRGLAHLSTAPPLSYFTIDFRGISFQPEYFLRSLFTYWQQADRLEAYPSDACHSSDSSASSGNDSDACHASKNPMQREKCEAGGRQPVITTGFEFEGMQRRLFGRFRCRCCWMFVDPGVSEIHHF